MTFQNPTISISELPRSADIDFSILDRRYAPLCLAIVVFVECVFVLAALIALTVFSGMREFINTAPGSLVIILSFIILVWIALKTWLTAAAIRFSLRQHDLVVRTGIFWRSETVQPLRRVQHVELTRGPLDKRFGLANVKLFSAGTGQSTFVVPGLEVTNAEKVKAYILDYPALDEAQEPV